MSEIRDRIVKILKESNISFMEDIEIQPDLFDAEDVRYKDGKRLVNFTDIIDAMRVIAPNMDYVDEREDNKNGLIWIIFEPNGYTFDDKEYKRIENELHKHLGDDVDVKMNVTVSQYAPELRKLYVGYVDGETEYNNDVDESLEEGWKDNLKKGAAILGVAGALAGNAHATDNHDPYYDRGPYPEQSELYKDVKSVDQYKDKVVDKDGNEWTMDQWADVVADRDPYDDRVYSPDDIDDDDVENFAKENGFMKNEDGTYTLDIDDSRFTKDELIDFMSKLDQGQ